MKMKLSIVTVHNSLNCGSYLQAFALMNALNPEQNDISFVDTKARKPFQSIVRSSIKYIITGKFNKLFFLLNKWKKFYNILQLLPTCKNSYEVLRKKDTLILGSDEIWNVKRKEFYKFPIFWGEGIDDVKIVAYAPSINRSSVEHIKKMKFPERNIHKFSAIGVRDLHSLNTLKNITEKKIEIVLDPTLLFDTKFYSRFEKPVKFQDYILVYTYSNHLNNTQIGYIREFARLKGKPLISINHHLDWCDINYAASPFEFLTFYKKAEYVITDTFHGTLFSIIYNKQFITFAGDNIKILDILETFNLNSQNNQDNKNIKSILETPIDYKPINNKLEELRTQSRNFINREILSNQNVHQEIY